MKALVGCSWSNPSRWHRIAVPDTIRHGTASGAEQQGHSEDKPWTDVGPLSSPAAWNAKQEETG